MGICCYHIYKEILLVLASWSCVDRIQPASKFRQVDIGQLGCTLYMLSFSLYQSLYQRHLQLGCTYSFCNSANSKKFKEQIIAMRIWFCGRDWKSAQSFTLPREVCTVILYSLCTPSFLLCILFALHLSCSAFSLSSIILLYSLCPPSFLPKINNETLLQ